MNKHDTKLLIEDLCARLPYGVEVEVDDWLLPGVHKLNGYEFGWFVVEGNYYNIDEIKPYLRPMSNITEKEKRELSDGTALAFEPALNGIVGFCPETMAYHAFNVDYCLRHHLDYRGLIENGLALEAPEGMY